jgi:hypothetical protein
MSLPVVISFSNYGYLDFTINFLKNVKSTLTRQKTVFYCLDSEIEQALQEFKSDLIILVKWDTTLSKQFESYHSSGFNKIMHTKTSIILDALDKYQFIHFVDADVVFCKEPTIDYYEKYRDYDVVYQNDAPPPNKPFHSWTCAGNFTLRNNENTKDLLNKIVSYEQKYPNMNDQGCQAQLFKDNGCEFDIRNYPFTKLYEFPMEEFSCGYLVKNNMIKTENIIVFHANHVIGKNEKIDLLKKINKWYN